MLCCFICCHGLYICQVLSKQAEMVCFNPIHSHILGPSHYCLGQFHLFQDWEFIYGCRILVRASIQVATLVPFWLFEITGCVVVSTFGILTYCYIKHNALEEDDRIKEAIAKSSFYLVAKTILTVFTKGLLSLIPTIRMTFTTTTTKVLFYFGIFLLQLPGVLTPILMIVALEPLRKAIKEIKKKLQSCCKTNVVHPSNST